jgi:DNA modification methylase
MEYKNKIFNESNEETLKRLEKNSVDLILTSPFYNSTPANRGILNKNKNKYYPTCRYDEFSDNLSFEEYIDYNSRLFNGFDKILKKNGVILWNLSYGTTNPDGMFLTVSSIIEKSEFSMADCIVWKKKSAIPNNVNCNRLTRITEFIFVFVRKNEINSFYMNKKKLSESKTGQSFFENLFNFVEADNNDAPCPYNKATFSTDLCLKLLKMYAPTNAVVYDPFMGTGTTAVACKKLGLNYIGSEISKKQVEWAEERIKNGFVTKDTKSFIENLQDGLF